MLQMLLTLREVRTMTPADAASLIWAETYMDSMNISELRR